MFVFVVVVFAGFRFISFFNPHRNKRWVETDVSRKNDKFFLGIISYPIIVIHLFNLSINCCCFFPLKMFNVIFHSPHLYIIINAIDHTIDYSLLNIAQERSRIVLRIGFVLVFFICMCVMIKRYHYCNCTLLFVLFGKKNQNLELLLVFQLIYHVPEKMCFNNAISTKVYVWFSVIT